MTDSDWFVWVAHHTTMFYLKSEDDEAMVNGWRPLFDQFAVAELKTASLEMLKDPPKYRDQHVSGLLRVLSAKRAAANRAFAEQNDHAKDHMRIACGLCDGTGYALVPHPSCLQGVEFVVGPGGYKATTAVCCSCYMGSKKLQSFDSVERKPLSLHAYEQIHGVGWRALMDEWASEQEKKADAVQSAKWLDAKKGPIAKQLSDRLRANDSN